MKYELRTPSGPGLNLRVQAQNHNNLLPSIFIPTQLLVNFTVHYNFNLFLSFVSSMAQLFE